MRARKSGAKKKRGGGKKDFREAVDFVFCFFRGGGGVVLTPGFGSLKSNSVYST